MNKKCFIALVALAAASLAVLPACESRIQIEVTSLDVKPAEVTLGQTVSVTAQITNIGGAGGNYRAALSVDGSPVDSQDVYLDRGSTQIVTFSLPGDKAGHHEVTVGNKAASLIVNPKLAAKEVELKYEDSKPRDCLSLVKPGTGYLVFFEPSSETFILRQVRIFGLVYGSPGYHVTGGELQIWDKDKKVIYSTPFNCDEFPLRTRLGDNLDSTGSWVDVNLPKVNVQGNFYVNIYTGIPGGQGFRMGAADYSGNTHSDVTVRISKDTDTLSPTWPYSIAYWYGDKSRVNWMVRVVGDQMIPQP